MKATIAVTVTILYAATKMNIKQTNEIALRTHNMIICAGSCWSKWKCESCALETGFKNCT